MCGKLLEFLIKMALWFLVKTGKIGKKVNYAQIPGAGMRDNMDQSIYELFERYVREDLEQIIISNPSKGGEITKIKIRPVQGKGTLRYQAVSYKGTKVFHRNYEREELLCELPSWFEGEFKAAELKRSGACATLLLSKKGKVTIKEKKLAVPKAAVPAAHNREKEYIIREGMEVPFLCDLGVMTAEGKIVRAKYDKFRQINRFLEFIEDILPELEKRARTRQDGEIRIIDFGCGKSYLTFAVYYYLHERKGMNVRITGLDLKQDVIETCSRLAEAYGYEKLSFLHGDIASYEGEDAVDMVITLHACDTATDYALYKAVLWNAAVILSVPCCQHELNRQISCSDLSLILGYGLIKERTAALFTDAMRAGLLECVGYQTQILEFIDMEHTPKNILLRCVKRAGKQNRTDREKKRREYEALRAFLNADPTLYRLLSSEAALERFEEE